MENSSKIKLKRFKEISHKNEFLSNEKNLRIRSKRFTNYFKRIGEKVRHEMIKDNYISNNQKEDYKQKIRRIRNPGIDLVRIIAMLNIVMTHYLYYGKVHKRFPKYQRQFTHFECFIDWHNNAFILLSGIVGYKTNKYSNLLYLWLTVFFYSVGIHYYYTYIKKGFIIKQDIFKELFPIVFRRYWFFTSYFGMYLFLPIINKGIEYATKSELRAVIITVNFIFGIWRYYKNPGDDIFLLSVGASITWFISFYLTGAYIGKYKVDYFGFKKIIFCFICLFIFLIITFLFIKSSLNEFYLNIGNIKIVFPHSLKRIVNGRYDSLVKVIQSITVTLLCLQIHFNKYLARIISFFGPLVFGVYLIHMHNLIKRNIVIPMFNHYPSELNLNSVISIVLIKSFKLFIICIIIDYLRHLLFTFLRIKNILIFIERKIKEKFY